MIDKDIKISSKISADLALIVLFAFIAKLALWGWFRAEYTDSIIQLQLFHNKNTYFPPLFPTLSMAIDLLISNPVLSGRFVSILASVILVIPLYSWCNRLGGKKLARYSVILWILSPVGFRWSLHAMTDMTFTFFFFMAVKEWYEVSKSIKEENEDSENNKVWRFWLWAGLAVLTRYQGLALVPIGLLLLWQTGRKGILQKNGFGIILSLIPWIILIGWIAYRGFGHTDQFVSRTHDSWEYTWKAYLLMGGGFITTLPYALTYPFTLALLIGIVPVCKEWRKSFLWVNLYLFVVWLIAHSAFQSFQYRYFLPLIPFGCMIAAMGILKSSEVLQKFRLSWIPGFVVIGWLSIMTLLVLGLQRDAFADIVDTALYVKEQVPPQAVVYSDEVYNQGNENIKMAYWAERSFRYFDPKHIDLKPGDFLVFHCEYTPLEDAYGWLSQHYNVSVVNQSTFRLMPLLPDIMTDPPVTSSPVCWYYRYTWQTYQGIVLRIDGLK